jgi:hypothetical protein
VTDFHISMSLLRVKAVPSEAENKEIANVDGDPE